MCSPTPQGNSAASHCGYEKIRKRIVGFAVIVFSKCAVSRPSAQAIALISKRASSVDSFMYSTTAAASAAGLRGYWFEPCNGSDSVAASASVPK